MHYEIVITAVEEVEFEGQSWNKVADSGNVDDGGPIYRYVSCLKKEVKRRELLKQQVDELDMKAVVKTINEIA